MQTESMPKDLMFKLRLEERDRQRLDAIAAHYEMTAAQTVRQLLKEKAHEIGIEARSTGLPQLLNSGEAKKKQRAYEAEDASRRVDMAAHLKKQTKKR